VWETAVVIGREPGVALSRSGRSDHHRATGYEVGRTMASDRPLSKLVPLPDDVGDRDGLRASGAFSLALTEPAPVADGDHVLVHACVIVTVGATRASLVDTQRRSIRFVPRELGRVLEAHRGRSLAELARLEPEVDREMLRRWLGRLVTADLAMVVDDPEHFPEIDLTPADGPGVVTSAVVDLSPGSALDLPSLVAELDGLGCRHLELRHAEPVTPSEVGANLDSTEGSRLRSVQVVAPWTTAWTEPAVEALCAASARLSLLVLHGAPEPAELGDDRYRALLVTETVDDHAACGFVHARYFSPGLEMVVASRAGDTCLLGKVGIDRDGVIRNCPTHPVARGHLGVDRLADVVTSPEFRAPAAITKDEVAGCRVCELRSVCSHCQVRADDPRAKPTTCRYDPTTGRWDG
jgi:SPASM domain peptide maturase of grasp-with-spasm system